ncbi:restriction endonuclease subunit S [Clostridium scatologenes]|uniref:Restriction modification system DNA specificity domain protein n=1 Tax=Clostridium scatologenes TaxID=1548 RepID=A0A0E3M9A2_CLOSL|nr:restriction endonuclease subunit S [Clostridium scatologenes]AKA69325.1 restriction modification system DNA specificity domain protein [Clostridium scatologenes]
MAKKKQLTLEEKLEEAIVKYVPYEVPGNWVWVNLGETCDFSQGVQVSKEKQYEYEKDNSVRFIRIIDYTQNIDERRYIDIPNIQRKCFVKENDIIMVRYGASAGFVGRGIAGVIANNMFKITQKDENVLSKDYLYQFLKNPYIFDILNNSGGASAMPAINFKVVAAINVPVPPLKEQQRIVDRIESLFEKLDKAKELIEEAREEFDKRKSAILEKAFRGELTEKWRDKHKILENNLLNDIVDYYMHKLSKSDFIKIKELQDIAKKKSSEMKSKWIKCYIGAVSKVGNGSTPSRKIEEYWNGDIPWVSSGEVKNNRITFTKENITKEGFENSSVKLLNKGSVLIAMIGEGKTRGQSSILDIEATTNQNIAAIDLSHGRVLSEFMWYWLQFNYKKNRDSGNGTGPKALNCQKVRELEFVLPPLEEQKEIVKILDNLLEEESKIEEFTQLEDQIELIKKSILAKAFRGELGTNSEEDESALKLLKEILSKDI